MLHSGGNMMSKLSVIGLVAVPVALVSISAFAAETKMKGGTMSMMKHSEVVAVMPDGHMGTLKLDQKMMGSMAKMATPMAGCTMMMTDKDGKVWTVDTSSPDAMAECEKIAK